MPIWLSTSDSIPRKSVFSGVEALGFKWEPDAEASELEWDETTSLGFLIADFLGFDCFFEEDDFLESFERAILE